MLLARRSAFHLRMMLDDRTYFLRRALQEDAAARIAGCEAARQRHLELAAAYRIRCRPNAAITRLDSDAIVNFLAPAA